MYKYLYYRIVMFYHNHSRLTGTECNQARTAITVFFVIEMFWLLNVIEDYFPALSLSIEKELLCLAVLAIICEVILYKYFKTLDFKEMETKMTNPKKHLLGNIFIVLFLLIHLFMIFTL